MRLLDGTQDAEIKAIREALHADDRVFQDRARLIVDAVRKDGEPAVLRYTAFLDGADLDTVRLSDELWDELAEQVSSEIQQVMHRAAARIRAFHEPQRAEGYTVGRCSLLIRPLDVVGLYVPGGRASYPSTVLMNAIPAQVAGVPRICMATPPGPDGTIDPAVAAAARIAGVTDLFLMGGAQAVAAFAYGAASNSGAPVVPPVDRIAGPGNAWVAAAKRLVSHRVGVDMEAGPSEVLVLADDSADSQMVARDLIAQAEHDPRALCIGVIVGSPHLAEAIAAAVEALLEEDPNRVAAQALKARGTLIRVDELHQGVELVNRLAPEHLELAIHDPESVLPQIRSAGAIFLGPHAPASVGDYMAGPNHTLPTGGHARFQSPLGVYDFQKRMSVIGWNTGDLAAMGRDVATFAREEGLVAHAQAVEARLDGLEPTDPLPPDPGLYVRPEVRRQKAYMLEAPADPPVKLDQNEAPKDLPGPLKEEVAGQLSESPWHRYPPFDPSPWRERIAEHTGWRPDGVLLGNGSNEMLSLLMSAVIRPGDKVVIATPCFSLYPLHLDAHGARIERVPLQGTDMSFDMDALERAARDARMVLLASPNNPTGSVLPPGAIPRLLETGSLVVIDEAYHLFSQQDLASELAQDKPLVLLRSFSKAWAAAAIRFGWLMGPPSFCTELQKILLPYNLSTLTLKAVDALLDAPELVEERVAQVRRERSRMTKALQKLGLSVVPSQANFLLFQAPGDATRVFYRLQEDGVLVRDVSSAVPGHLRVAVSTKADNDAFLAAMERAR